MRVLVTGIGGFVGAALARNLAERGHTVAGTYIRDRPEVAGAALFEADLLDPGELAVAIRAAAPEVVVHLAALSHVGGSWTRMADYYRVNFIGTENLLRAVGEVRTVFASSAEVYGAVPESEQPISEARQPEPRSPYAVTKAAAERLAYLHRATVARMFNLVGAGQSSQFALPSFAQQLADIVDGSAPPVLAVGNLAARRDFLHVEDGADALAVLVERGEPAGVYNLGSGEATSLEEALDLLVGISGAVIERRVDPERFRPIDLELLSADTGRLRGLGWSPRRSLHQALEELWHAARRSRPARSGQP